MSAEPRQIRVLGSGLDPYSAADASLAQDGDDLKKQLQASIDQINATPNLQFEVAWLYLSDEKPAQRLADALEGKEWDAVLIGWGVRGFPESTELFEECIDAVRKAVPLSTKLIFSKSPHDHLETIVRVFPELKQSQH